MKKLLKSIADNSALVALRSLVLPLLFLPEKLAFRIARFYISILFLVMRRLEGVAKRNLELVFPDKGEEERAEIFRKSKDILAENFLGFARIPKLTPAKARDMCDYAHATKEMNRLRAGAKGVGVLIPTIHFDAFEFFIQVHALNYGPVSILGRGFGMKNFDRWWNGRRETHGNTIFSRKGGYKEIVRRLKNGEDVVIMCDQNVKANHAVFANFFGVKAATTKTVALAAMRTGAPILFGSPVGTSEGHFKVTAEEILHPNDVEGDTETKLLASTEAMHRHFEQQILRRPEAWFWIHRRWKTRPPGEPETIYT